MIGALGVNYYNPSLISAPLPGEDLPFSRLDITGYPTTDFGWPVVPSALRDMLVTLRETYGEKLPPVWITESGCSYAPVEDQFRIDYHAGHLAAVREAIAAGVDVRGYCAWSLLDNFEWADGFTQRFGLVHVDYDTLVRTPKRSFDWYADVIRAHRGTTA